MKRDIKKSIVKPKKENIKKEVKSELNSSNDKKAKEVKPQIKPDFELKSSSVKPKKEALIMKGVKLTPQELSIIEAKAKELKLSFSEYARRKWLDNNDIIRAEKADEKLTKALGQLTKYSNEIENIRKKIVLKINEDASVYAEIHKDLLRFFEKNYKLYEEIKAALK